MDMATSSTAAPTPRKAKKEWPDLMCRKDAAAYLTECGYKIAPQTLANCASNNNAKKGPPFTRYSWQLVLYSRADLDAWAARAMSGAVRVG